METEPMEMEAIEMEAEEMETETAMVGTETETEMVVTATETVAMETAVPMDVTIAADTVMAKTSTGTQSASPTYSGSVVPSVVPRCSEQLKDFHSTVSAVDLAGPKSANSGGGDGSRIRPSGGDNFNNDSVSSTHGNGCVQDEDNKAHTAQAFVDVPARVGVAYSQPAVIAASSTETLPAATTSTLLSSTSDLAGAGSPLVGRWVAREFDDGIFFGTIKEHLPVGTLENADVEMWAVEFDDGDEADYNHDNIQAMLVLYKQCVFPFFRKK